MPEVMYGVYSAVAAKQYGFNIYVRPDGTEVEVTGVYNQPNDPCYMWPDAIWIGVVLEWKAYIPTSNIEIESMDFNRPKNFNRPIDFAGPQGPDGVVIPAGPQGPDGSDNG